MSNNSQNYIKNHTFGYYSMIYIRIRECFWKSSKEQNFKTRECGSVPLLLKAAQPAAIRSVDYGTPCLRLNSFLRQDSCTVELWSKYRTKSVHLYR